ncbi:MAG: ATP--guanido phosphotransferase [Firmicutes bacterium]|nr:ATP--guanido phosphotransferase [Bacillota bacterium]
MTESNIIISSRIRLARNLRGVPFPNKLTAQAAREYVSRPISKILSDNCNLTVINIMDLTQTEQHILHERRLISKDLFQNALNGIVALNNDESISVMVNEEDHIREQCILPGLFLLECFEELNNVDDELLSGLNIAFDSKLGFLTSSPTNLGTGMRASVMCFLPALTILNKINDSILNMTKLGITVRGGYGEGSNAEGYMYQVSNSSTLGISEFDIIRNVTEAVRALAKEEAAARVVLYREQATGLTDEVFRAWGILTNCFKLDMHEFLMLLSKIKMGVALGIIGLKNAGLLDELDVKCRPYNLIKTSGRELKGEEIDIFRADYLGKLLMGGRS